MDSEQHAIAAEKARDLLTKTYFSDTPDALGFMDKKATLSEFISDMSWRDFDQECSEMLLCNLSNDRKFQRLIEDAAEYRDNFNDIQSGFYPIAAAIVLMMLESAENYAEFVQ